MRNKKTFILLFGLGISISSFAQFSAGLETGLAATNSPDIGSFGVGGSIRYEAPIQNKLSWACGLGYSSFLERIQDGYPTGNKIISISNGVKYYFLESANGLYAAVDLGLDITSSKRGILSPGIGYRTSKWDFTGRYNAISEANYFSLRAAYVFRLK